MDSVRRWQTGALLALLFVAVLLSPPAVFALAAAAVFCLAAWEWGALSSLRRARLPYALGLGLAPLLFWRMGEGPGLALSLAALLWWGAALWWVLRYPEGARIWSGAVGRSLAGAAVLAPACVSLLALRNEPSILPLVFLVTLVAAVDIGAWLVGSTLGQTPLLPAVSPRKTRAGFWGGILCALALIIIVAPFVSQGLRLALAGAVAAFAAVLGDLLESMFKRQAGVRDSGALLPGHGGILDRIDALCAAAPSFFVVWRVW